MPLALSQHTLAEGARPPCEAGRKRGAVAIALVWQVLHEDPKCRSRVVRDKGAQRQVAMAVRVRPLNRLRVKGKRHRSTGRPGRRALLRPGYTVGAVVQVRPPLSSIGVPLLAHWLAQPESGTPVVARLLPAIEAEKPPHPDDAFALLPPREQTL